MNLLNHRRGVMMLILYGDLTVAEMIQGSCPMESPYALFVFILFCLCHRQAYGNLLELHQIVDKNGRFRPINISILRYE